MVELFDQVQAPRTMLCIYQAPYLGTSVSHAFKCVHATSLLTFATPLV